MILYALTLSAFIQRSKPNVLTVLSILRNRNNLVENCLSRFYGVNDYGRTLCSSNAALLV